jgi:hypothetical protein
VGLFALVLGILLALGSTTLLLLLVFHLDDLQQAFWMVLSTPHLINAIAALSLFFALLLAMRIAGPNNTVQATTNISV